METINFVFIPESYVLFYSTPYGAFFALFGPFGSVLGLGSGSKKVWDLLI